MMKNLWGILSRSPLGCALAVLALFCLGTAGAFLCHRPDPDVDPHSGYRRLCAGEFHAPVVEAGVWMAVGPVGMQELICRNGVRVPLRHDAFLVLEPTDLLSYDVSGLARDDFPFYQSGPNHEELIRCRDGRRIPALQRSGGPSLSQ
ncbi:MAG: hypothetical protein U0793_00810 [Gemmataceae bacterium]